MRYTAEEINRDEALYDQAIEFLNKGGKLMAARILRPAEMKKRGCAICAFALSGGRVVERSANEKSVRFKACAFDHCILHELDDYRHFGEYMEAHRMELDKLDYVLGASEKEAKVYKNIKDLKKAVKKEKEDEKKLRALTKREKWMIEVRESQGFTADQVASEFNLTRERAEKELKLAKRRRIKGLINE